MDIKNLTESEQQDFYRLLKKMDGQETDKKQDAKVKKPKYGDTVYYINYVGEITRTTWLNVKRDSEMWELGNVFFTEEAAKFAREKKKVEVEPYRISAPVAGKVIDIKDTNDQVFNSEALGKGVGIIASELSLIHI